MPGLSVQHPWAFAFGLLGNVISFMTYLAPLQASRSITADVLPDLQEQVDAGFPIGSLRGGALQRDAVDLLRAAQVRRVPPHHHQLRWLFHRDHLHRRLPHLRAKASQAVHGEDPILLLNVGVFGLILLLTLLLSEGEKRVVMLGWVCVSFSVSVFIAPLSVIRLVVRTRSVEFMPFSLSLSLTISAVVWFLYGLLIVDKYVALPNILGFAFGVIQMGLYALYRNPTPRPAPKEVDAPVSNDGAVKAPEHVVSIDQLGPAAAIELNTHYPVEQPPTMKEGANGVACASDETKGGVEKLDKATHVEQV